MWSANRIMRRLIALSLLAAFQGFLVSSAGAVQPSEGKSESVISGDILASTGAVVYGKIGIIFVTPSWNKRDELVLAFDTNEVDEISLNIARRAKAALANAEVASGDGQCEWISIIASLAGLNKRIEEWKRCLAGACSDAEKSRHKDVLYRHYSTADVRLHACSLDQVRK